MNASAQTAGPLDVLVIGAGFGGLAMANALRKIRGLRFHVLEKERGLGGAWRDNTYPGCACDIPSHLYSLSFAPNAEWSQLYAPQPEILSYMERLAETHGLRRFVTFGAGVAALSWDREAQHWLVKLSNGETRRSRFVVSAMGVLHHPAVPRLDGLENFRGKVFHSSRWDHSYDLAGKRVAVLGTGASAIQFVPQIVDRVAGLMLFQRTAPWIVPKTGRVFGAWRRRLFRHLPFYRRHFRNRLFWAHEKRALGFHRQDPAILARTEKLCRDLLARQVKDEALRARLTPDYRVGCKRLLISSDYYPALQRANARLVTDPIARVEPDAIVTRDGVRHPCDAIIFGTGFDIEASIGDVRIKGAEGRDLGEIWREEGASAYLGTMVAGFPNLFFITGPNAGSGHNSQLFMIEAQTRYIVSAIAQARRMGLGALDVKPSVQQAFADELERRMTQTVWAAGGCKSWYQDGVTGRNRVLWPGFSLDYWWRTRRAALADFSCAPVLSRRMRESV